MAPLVRHFREHVRRYALVLAVCQVAVLSSATLVLAAASRSGALTVGADEECRCDHTAGVMCPMHRRTSSRPVPADAPRWCTGVDDSAYGVLPVLGGLALPERIAQVVRPNIESRATVSLAEAPRPLARPPDSPPPRV